eukprot:3143434-Rhodomonas_salina.2
MQFMSSVGRVQLPRVGSGIQFPTGGGIQAPRLCPSFARARRDSTGRTSSSSSSTAVVGQ